MWIGVGGTPQSFARAWTRGLPLMVAIIGGSFERFRTLVELYREAGAVAGHAPETLRVGIHAMGFVGDSDIAARDAFDPGWGHLMGTISRERGYAPPTRAQFDAMANPEGAFLIGAPDTVAAKMPRASKSLGELSRITFQMTCAALESKAMQRSIELLGREVAPIVRASERPGPHSARPGPHSARREGGARGSWREIDSLARALLSRKFKGKAALTIA